MTTFRPTTIVEQRHLTFEVTDAPALQLNYGKINIVPDTVKITFKRTDFGPWKVEAVSVLGGRQLKSGKASDKQFARQNSNYSGWDFYENAPTWLVEFVASVTPPDSCAIPVMGLGDELIPCRRWPW